MTRFVSFSQLTFLLTLSICIIVLSACNNNDDDISSKEDIEKPEEECINSAADGYRSILQGSEMREYILYIPASYDSNSPTPLVINYHGFGDCAAGYADDIGEFYGLNELADNENFIVAYPQATFCGEKGDNYWEPGNTGSQDIIENDTYFTEQLIADIKDQLNVDLTRVYATGYSNGGMMSYSLACSSNFFAAIGIMSGTMLAEDCNENEYTSIIHFHGIDDEVLPYAGNEDYDSIADIMNFWVNHNNIPTSSLVTTQFNNGDIQRDEYSGGNENTSVVLYTINNEFDKPGGHVWFSGDIDGTSANKILWDFLSAHSL